MIMTPSSFSYELLSSLKFKELQKLSAQFHVNKRWAKKQELIENLLGLKKKIETTIFTEQEDQTEWKDGSTVFADSNLNSESQMRRLTYNITKKFEAKKTDSRLTFEVPQNDETLLEQTIASRETYDIAPKEIDLGVEPLLEPRATFDIPQYEILLEEVDSRATFEVPQNERKLLQESEIKSNEKCNKNIDVYSKNINNIAIEQNLRKINFDLKLKSGKKEKNEMTQVKMLTIPCARVTKRTKLDEASKPDSSLIKLSKRSINIKKCTRIPVGKSDLIKSPTFSIKNTVKKKTVIKSVTKLESTDIIQNKGLTGLQFTEEKQKQTENVNISDKENMKIILKTRTLKPADDECKNKLNFGKINYKTPATKDCKALPLRKTFLRDVKDEKLNLNGTQTPENSVVGNKLNVKPITLTKMPDFNKIHKRQFEQMDSLHDYLKKKDERIKKLFGTPQPGQQLLGLNKPRPVFHFQSSILEKKCEESETSKILTTPVKKKESNFKMAQKEAFKCKLPPLNLRTDIKDKNRSHIYGVRTNKRFELQMKLRKM